MEGDKEPPYAAGEQQLEEGDEEEDEFHDFQSELKQNLRR